MITHVLPNLCSNLLKGANRFVWGDEQQKAFDALKQKLMTGPILWYGGTEACRASAPWLGPRHSRQHMGIIIAALVHALVQSEEENLAVNFAQHTFELPANVAQEIYQGIWVP